jgi:hypothetical protein
LVSGVCSVKTRRLQVGGRLQAGARALIATAVTVHLRPPLSETLAALLAARRLRPEPVAASRWPAIVALDARDADRVGPVPPFLAQALSEEMVGVLLPGGDRVCIVSAGRGQ